MQIIFFQGSTEIETVQNSVFKKHIGTISESQKRKKANK